MIPKNTPENFGADPAVIKWVVVRGDSSSIRIDFLENDEITKYDTSDWEFLASAYDPKTDVLDSLDISTGEGYVIVSVSPAVSAYWGTGYNRSTLAELNFDIEVTIGDVVWTPVVGVISVIGDVSGTL